MSVRHNSCQFSDKANVLVDGDSGEALREHASAVRTRSRVVRVALTEEDVSKPSSGKSEIESADAAEE